MLHQINETNFQTFEARHSADLLINWVSPKFGESGVDVG